MNPSGLFLARLYAGLLSFYPRLFRKDFGSEMQAIFEQALVEASASGQVAVFFMRELHDWPVALLQAHLQERRLQTMSGSSGERPIRWWGVLAGMGLFLLPVFYHISSKAFHNMITGVLLLILLVFMLAALLFGIFKGLPRWCLPSFGMVFGIIWMYLGLQLMGFWLTPLMNRVAPVGNEASRYAGQAIMNGVFWVPLFLISIVLVLIFALLPPLRALYWRIRTDWTMVSLTLYGAIVFALFIDWDEYSHEEIFVAACYLFLAVGVAGYLLSRTNASRIAWLLGGAALSMITMAVGKFILVPMQDWPMWFQWHTKGTERWFESLRSLIELAWILLVLLAPSVLLLLPSAKEPAVENSDPIRLVIENSADSASPR